MPHPGLLVPALNDVALKLLEAVAGGPRVTISLMHLRAGQIVASTYLTIMHSTALRGAGEPEERITAVASWRDAPYFTAPERVALALVEAVLIDRHVPDTLYDEAAGHYDLTELATLTGAIAQVGFFIPLVLIGRPLPGRPPSAQWTKP